MRRCTPPTFSRSVHHTTGQRQQRTKETCPHTFYYATQDSSAQLQQGERIICKKCKTVPHEAASVVQSGVQV